MILTMALAMFTIPAFSAPAQQKSVELTLHSRGAPAGLQWPVTFGVPFPEGQLTSPDSLRMTGPNGQNIPIQVRQTATWFDNSVQWVLIDAQAPLPADKASYRMTWGVRTAQLPAGAQVTWRETADRLLVDTGELRFEVSKRRLVPFENISFKDQQGRWVSAFPERRHSELYLEDGEGNAFRGSLSDAPDVVVEEKGLQRVSIKIEGWMQSDDGRKLGRRIVRIYAFAGMKSLRVYDTFVNTADTDKVKFANISLHLPFKGDQFRFHDAGMDQPREVKQSTYLLQHEHDAFEVVSEGQVVSQGKRAPGRVTVSDGDTAYTVAWRHFWQMYPNEIEAMPGQLRLHFWPRHGKPARYRHEPERVTVKNIPQVRWVHEGEVLDFTPPDDVVNFDYPDYRHDNIENIVGTNAMGIARTSEYWLDFHGQGSQEDAADRIDAFEAHPLVLADPKWIAESQAFWNVAEFNEQYASVEEPIAKMLDFYVAMYESLGDYGKWIYGGYHQDYMPGFEYAWVHRTWPGFHHGMPRWPWLTLIRTGDPRYFTFAELLSRNLTDISIVHWEDREFNANHYPKPAPPYRSTGKNLGAQTRYKGIVPWHEGQEVSYNAQVDFALWYFYLTGYQHAWDTAMWQGQMLLREESLLRQEKGLPDAGFPPDNLFPTKELRDAYFAEHKGSMHELLTPGRQGTAPAAAALQLYRATHDERYLTMAKRIVDYGRGIEDERPGQGYANQYYAPMLLRYWEVTHDESIKPYVVKWARDRMKNEDARTWDGRDQYYDQMALAYQFTGDVEFLKHGLAQTRIILDNRFAPNMGEHEGVAYWAGGSSGVGYAGQEWGYFLRALENHYQRAGERLLPPGPTQAYPFTTLVSSTDHDGEQRILFHLRKAPGEAVDVDFRFNSREDTDVEWTLEDAADQEIASGNVTPVPAPRRAHPVASEGSFPIHLDADAPAGDYRVLLRSASRIDVHWPYRGQGQYAGLVVEMPVTMSPRFGPPLRVIMPVADALDITVPEADYRSFGTYWLYDADGNEVFAYTGAGTTNTPAQFRIPVAPALRDRPWFYRRSESQSSTPDLEITGILPILGAEKETFFVPERIRNVPAVRSPAKDEGGKDATTGEEFQGDE
jgi:hypothetical protein